MTTPPHDATRLDKHSRKRIRTSGARGPLGNVIGLVLGLMLLAGLISAAIAIPKFIFGISGESKSTAKIEPSSSHAPSKPAFDADKWAAENRASALISQAEGDAELAKYAQEKRAEYKSKSIRYQSDSRDGVTIDSFELPGDVFIACTLSFPGPVYSCDETASATP